ncbi:MAG: HEPN domain-containing protein [Phycisphaerae bacterium]|nr:HEPN domain-containing protein [Phycisphaerae bacterium]
MSEPGADLWMRQAWSDFQAAKRVLDRNDQSTFCHQISKCQQTVEKAIKAMVAALRLSGIIETSPGYRHPVENLVSVLTHLPHQQENREIQNEIFGLLHEHHRGEIRAICALAPRRPAPGQLAPKNTEYPFQRSTDEWVAPTDQGVFQDKDTSRFRKIATSICEGAARIVSAQRRVNP